MDTRIRPIKRSKAETTRKPTTRCKRSASSSTTAHTSMVTVSAATHSMRLSGAWLTNNNTVAMAEGPAKAGMAKGTIKGSATGTGVSWGGGGKIIRKAIKNSTTAPPICRETSDKLKAFRNDCPANMKASSRPKAINTSRTMTRARRSGGTARSEFTKIGMLPSGSVISSSKMVAEAKVCSMPISSRKPCSGRQSL